MKTVIGMVIGFLLLCVLNLSYAYQVCDMDGSNCHDSADICNMDGTHCGH